MEEKEENKLSTLDELIQGDENKDNNVKIYELINSVFKDKSKKKEIIEKLRPFFTLKVKPQTEIDRVYSAIEKIDPEKIDFVEEFKYQEEKYDSKNIYETKSKSVGLSNYDLNLSASIFGHNQSLKNEDEDEKINDNHGKSVKFHCIHSIVVSLFRLVIDFNDIKLAKQLNEELNNVQNSNATEKKNLLENLVDKFRLYVPLELLLGGRINISFEADNDKEIKEIHSFLQNKIQVGIGGGIKNFSAELKLNRKKIGSNENLIESKNGNENLSIKLEGGNYLYNNDLKKWIQSFNIDNLQIIEYKTLIPIYCFIPGMESKLEICLQEYEDIVLQEIQHLIENDFKTKEKDLSEQSSENNNIWKVGITKEEYKSFLIYRKKIIKKIKYSYEEKELEIKDIICGKLPDGFIICGWILHTDSNSLPYEIVSNWERKKGLSIIGNNCFKFKIKMNFEENINEDVEVEWILEIFCIHNDFLIYNAKNKNSKNIEDKNNGHYFLNCDCSKEGKNKCIYNRLNNDENNIKKVIEDSEKKEEEEKEKEEDKKNNYNLLMKHDDRNLYENYIPGVGPPFLGGPNIFGLPFLHKKK